MKLTMMVGEAMATALNRRGIDIGRINYQDNGNWGVFGPEGPYLTFTSMVAPSRQKPRNTARHSICPDATRDFMIASNL